MTTPTDKASVTYTLPRDQAESIRLNGQHRCFTTSTGFLLHPRIASALEGQSDVRIADVGTGTGVWLLDTAQNFPAHWKYTGLDQSDAQFPKEKTKNIDFAVMDVLQTPPEHLQGVFDVVHLRLLVCGLRGDQWETAATNVLSMLKPGGWIQWHELSPPTLTVHPYVPGAGAAAKRLIKTGVEDQQNQGKFLNEDGPRLCERVDSVGFQQCEGYKVPSDRDTSTRAAATTAILGAMSGFLRHSVRSNGVQGKTGEEIEHIIAEAKVEMEADRVYVKWDTWMVTGRKAT